MLPKDAFVRTVKFLRRQFVWSATYKHVKEGAKIVINGVKTGAYMCNGCYQVICKDEDHLEKMSKELLSSRDNCIISSYAIDHIKVVGTLTDSLDEAARRIFCDTSNLQLLCTACHFFKTRVDLEEIYEQRKLNKPKE